MKKIYIGLFIAVVLLVGGSVFAQGSREKTDAAVRPLVLAEGWKIYAGDDPAFAVPDFDDDAWREVTFPITLSSKEVPGEGGNIAWLRTKVRLDAGTFKRCAYLLAGKLNGASEFYVNGELLYSHGRFDNRYPFYRDGLPKQFLIPAGIAGPSGILHISVRVMTDTGTFSFRPMRIGSRDDYLFDSHVLRFLNSDIFMILAILCVFIGAYFLFQFLFRTTETANLYFALGNFFFFLYLFELGTQSEILRMSLFMGFSKAALPLAFGFITVFFLEFFGFYNKRWLRLTLLGLSVVLAGLIIAGSSTIEGLMGFFTLSLIPGILEIVFMMVIAIKALKGGNKNALPIIVGTTFALVFGGFDIIHQVSGKNPFIWLQSEGIFLFNLSVFVSLSLTFMRMNRNLELYSKENAEKTESMKRYIDRIADISSSVSSISGKLNHSISLASASMDKTAVVSGQITEAAEGQSMVAGEAGNLVGSLLDSLEKIYERLNKQAEGLKRSVTAIEELNANISDITDHVRGTAEFTENLKTVVENGTRAVLSSHASISTIRKSSESIYEIVDAVNELAERTNLLSMNAAIEAAHAGEAGKGFAVVAGEIKKLAEGSSKEVRSIKSQVDGIIKKIEESVVLNDQVKNILFAIDEDTAKAGAQVQEIYASLNGQRSATLHMRESLGELDEAGQSMKELTDRQTDLSGHVRRGIEELLKASENVLAGTRAMAEEHREIILALSTVNDMSGQSLTVVKSLDELLFEKGAS